jgi:hypothetical protein
MDMFLVPVINGVLPRPDGGEVTGIFLDPYTAGLLTQAGEDSIVLLCPYDAQTERVYPAGVTARVQSMWFQDVYVEGPGSRVTALFASVEGQERVKPDRIESHGRYMVASGVKPIDPSALRGQDYPVIDGAGWQPLGGHTELKSPADIPVTIYGVEYETGGQVEITGNIGGIVSPEQAHTIEHAVIRSLQKYSMCTAKSLAQAIYAEGQELRRSVEIGYKMERPEIFGVTSSGACGNPLTNLAQFYLAKEMISGLENGHSLLESVETARKKALSKLTEELELTTEYGLRALQGLRRGMLHDDSPIAQKHLKRVLKRFPSSPWH